jgi:hypothetical protein
MSGRISLKEKGGPASVVSPPVLLLRRTGAVDIERGRRISLLRIA